LLAPCLQANKKLLKVAIEAKDGVGYRGTPSSRASPAQKGHQGETSKGKPHTAQDR
jgi:hypothetical protein